MTNREALEGCSAIIESKSDGMDGCKSEIQGDDADCFNADFDNSVYDGDDDSDDSANFPLTVPYDESSEDDDYAAVSPFHDDLHITNTHLENLCLHEPEDIDFEFVYALHTFVATVEGQANATKGDTMVLLDDSNSYWWLVRVVKDSSIGKLLLHHIRKTHSGVY